MAVTTTYGFDIGTTFQIHIGTGLTDLDLTSLSNGGFAAAGTYLGDHTDVFIYDGEGEYAHGAIHVIGGGAGPTAIAQLANHNIVNVYQVGSDIEFAIVALDGHTVHAASGLGFDPGSGPTAPENPDVAGLSGGKFAVAFDNAYSGTDHDIFVLFRNANGSGDQRIAVTFDDVNDDTAPSVVGLTDGGFAVAWTRTFHDTDETEVWRAVYESNGAERLAPTLIDTLGSINRDVSVVALASGGFAVVYEDNGWDATHDITLSEFDSAGSFILDTNVTSGVAQDCSEASATVLANGYLAVSFSRDFELDKDIWVQVVNPTTGALLGDAMFTAPFVDPDNEHASSIASLGLGGVVAAWYDDSDGDQAVEMQFQRTSTGNGANDHITGDNLMDIMNGKGGKDVLNGFGNSDTLKGGDGKDKIFGGNDADSLTGGTAGDQFIYTALADSTVAAPDTIHDLTNSDKINLKAIDADTTMFGNQAFHLIGAFSGHPAEALLVFHAGGIYAGKTTLELDVNGDSVADMLVLIAGDHHSYTHFIF